MIKLKEEIEKGKKAEFQIRDDGMCNDPYQIIQVFNKFDQI